MYDQGGDRGGYYEAMCEAGAQAEAEDYAARAENESKQQENGESCFGCKWYNTAKKNFACDGCKRSFDDHYTPTKSNTDSRNN